MKTGTDLINEAKTRITEVSAADVEALLAQGNRAVILDVREPNEFNLGHLPGAVHIPRGQLENRVEAMIPKTSTVIVYCGGGSRSALAADTLQVLGYTDVKSMTGGFRDWATNGAPVED
jgi:rhodanese-related sulfurtransferase